MYNSFLQAEKTCLLDRIAAIRATGPVAEAYCFVTTTSVTSGTGTTYEYARLVSQKRSTEKQKIKQLGRVGSEEHRHWQRATARRDAIVELEQQLNLLTALIDRQIEKAHLVEQDFEEPS